jgi:AcrR family transcriptional regulator
MPTSEKSRPGLRERKRVKTLATIQSEALRLFQLKGYEATTVVEIADAAEVSESTFFRYFPTKEDVVLLDDLDPVFTESLRAQPADLAPFQAIRAALDDLFGQLTGDERSQSRERIALVLNVPELRARMFDQFFGGTTLIADLIAERRHTDPNDPDIRILAGAVIGAGIAAMSSMIDNPTADLRALMAQALDRLETGFAN